MNWLYFIRRLSSSFTYKLLLDLHENFTTYVVSVDKKNALFFEIIRIQIRI